MTNNGITHLKVDGKNMSISPDLVPTFNFLMNVQKEVEDLLGVQERLEKIREQHVDMMDFAFSLSEKLKNNNIPFDYKFREHPALMADKLDLLIPIRSQMIVLFASLEVLYALYTAYDKEIDNEDSLRKATQDQISLKKFINSFILTDENDFYKMNKVSFLKFNSSSFRKLRNSLTHFFSLSGSLFVVENSKDPRIKKVEEVFKNSKRGDIVSISPTEIHGLMQGAHRLIVKRWSEDCLHDQASFGRKVKFVITIVDKLGARTVQLQI